jgi:hypothetical protein
MALDHRYAIDMSHSIEVSLHQERDCRFVIEFGAGIHALTGDEAPSLATAPG